jgi:hypothetical protein
MRRTALILAAAATVGIPLSWVTPAQAGIYYVKWCTPTEQPNPPGSTNGWSAQVSGSSNTGPSAFLDNCDHDGPSIYDWRGPGGAFGDGTTPGTQAFAKFVPPAGATISNVHGNETFVISTGAYAEAGIFAASTGRALGDNSAYLNGAGYANQGLGGAAQESLGPDGAQGVLIGARCPASLPPAAGGQCGGAGYALGSIVITIEDPSRPTVDASLSLDSAGKATLNWSATDPQSGIAQVTVSRAGSAPVVQTQTANIAIAPSYPVTVSGSTSVQLAEGETATYSISPDSNGGDFGQPVTKTVSVTRPRSSTPSPTTPTPSPATPTPSPATPLPTTTPVPTTPKPPVTAKVTLTTKALKGRRIALSGSARGCMRVSVKTPGSQRAKTAKVKSGKWSMTTARKRGTYRATCGAASAKRAVR